MTSVHVPASFGAVNRKCPGRFSARATSPIRRRCVSAGSRNISPQATAASKLRLKKSDSSTGLHSAGTPGNRSRNVAHEKRIGLGVPTQRRRHDDLQIDRAANPRLTVFEDGERAAERVRRTLGNGAGVQPTQGAVAVGPAPSEQQDHTRRYHAHAGHHMAPGPALLISPAIDSVGSHPDPSAPQSAGATTSATPYGNPWRESHPVSTTTPQSPRQAPRAVASST